MRAELWRQAALVSEPQLRSRIVLPRPFDHLGRLSHRSQLGQRNHLGSRHAGGGPREIDRLRARALLGDQLVELTDSDREWVWRSLLNGVRVAQSVALAGLEGAQLIPALAQIRTIYEHRIRSYKRGEVARLDIRTPADSERAYRGLWPFGSRR